MPLSDIEMPIFFSLFKFLSEITSDTMKVSITSGKSEGPTRLNAFDNALLDAGIGDVNLIPVSSILPANTDIVELPHIKEGEMVNCVLACAHSNRPGDLITAVVAVATSDDFGCVVEHSGINQNSEKIKSEAEVMVKYMMNVRGLSIREIIIADENHKVKNEAVAVAAVVYLK
jgi:arginine decarboxylase